MSKGKGKAKDARTTSQSTLLGFFSKQPASVRPSTPPPSVGSSFQGGSEGAQSQKSKRDADFTPEKDKIKLSNETDDEAAASANKSNRKAFSKLVGGLGAEERGRVIREVASDVLGTILAQPALLASKEGQAAAEASQRVLSPGAKTTKDAFKMDDDVMMEDVSE
ncbi:hypothetical protein BDY24DRAFT_440354 [Mrakia frigida]|uniref:uncharacterized protein n=1 Tax=Mrakia frigida TaxID=29902 RepID=UPI003FCBFB75